MTLQGSLDAFALPDIFQLLSFSQKSGALHLRGESVGLVYFHSGEVYYASSKSGDTLGNALVRSGVVSEEIWKSAVAESRNSRSVGEVLLRERAADPDRLESFLRERIEEAVFDLLRWTKGRFDFRAGETHALGPVFTFSVDPLISEGRRRLEEWAVITEAIPSVNVAIEMIRSLPEEHREVTLTREEWRVLSCVDARRTVAELARQLGEGEFHICQVLHALVSTGLIHVLERPLPEVEPPLEDLPDVEPVLSEEADPGLDEDSEAEEAEDEPELVAEVSEDEGAVVAAQPEPEPEPELEESELVSDPDEVYSLSLADAAAALEGGSPPLEPLEPHLEGVSALEVEELAPERELAPSVSADLFADLQEESSSSTLNDALLSDVLAAPITRDLEPDSLEAASIEAASAAAGGKGRIGSAALAREFGQAVAAPQVTAPAPSAGLTEGVHALDAEEQPEVEPEEAVPTPKTAGLNKTLILRLISGVKDL